MTSSIGSDLGAGAAAVDVERRRERPGVGDDDDLAVAGGGRDQGGERARQVGVVVITGAGLRTSLGSCAQRSPGGEQRGSH
ncbi:MAG: hypothetical protein ACQSGP_26240, partial [Frankia sp.]